MRKNKILIGEQANITDMNANTHDTQPVVHKPFAILKGSMYQLQSPKFHQHWNQPVLRQNDQQKPDTLSQSYCFYMLNFYFTSLNM